MIDVAINFQVIGNNTDLVRSICMKAKPYACQHYFIARSQLSIAILFLYSAISMPGVPSVRACEACRKQKKKVSFMHPLYRAYPHQHPVWWSYSGVFKMQASVHSLYWIWRTPIYVQDSKSSVWSLIRAKKIKNFATTLSIANKWTRPIGKGFLIKSYDLGWFAV